MLQLTEVEKPTPNGNVVLVRVHAVSASAVDWRTMRGAPFALRLIASCQVVWNRVLHIGVEQTQHCLYSVNGQGRQRFRGLGSLHTEA